MVDRLLETVELSLLSSERLTLVTLDEEADEAVWVLPVRLPQAVRLAARVRAMTMAAIFLLIFFSSLG